MKKRKGKGERKVKIEEKQKDIEVLDPRSTIIIK
jgi:hypothetical protein